MIFIPISLIFLGVTLYMCMYIYIYPLSNLFVHTSQIALHWLEPKRLSGWLQHAALSKHQTLRSCRRSNFGFKQFNCRMFPPEADGRSDESKRQLERWQGLESWIWRDHCSSHRFAQDPERRNSAVTSGSRISWLLWLLLFTHGHGQVWEYGPGIYQFPRA